jgi:hypothetical protein
MCQFNSGTADAGSGGYGKYLFEVQSLPSVDKVEHSIGFKVSNSTS